MPTDAKQQILNSIKTALVQTVPMPFPQSEGSQTVYIQSNNELIVTFAEEFTKLQGKFIFCESNSDFQNQLQTIIAAQQWQNIYCVDEQFKSTLTSLGLQVYNALPTCQASITGCEYLVARTGTIVLSAAQQSAVLLAYMHPYTCMCCLHKPVGARC